MANLDARSNNGVPASLPLAFPAVWAEWMDHMLGKSRMPLSGDVSEWIRAWGEAISQIGLINVNIEGSADPKLEKRISSHYSYGRQLGRMLDVLIPLVEANEALLVKKVGDKDLAQFKQMAADIQRLKRSSVADIVSEVRRWKAAPTFAKDLAELQRELTALKAEPGLAG